MRRSLSVVSVVLLAAVAALTALTGRAAAQPPPTLTDSAGGPEDGLAVTLQTDGAPTPGGLATLTLTATALVDAPNMEMRWVVPDGATLLGDPLESVGALAAGQSAASTRQVRFPARGVYKVAASASFSPAEGTRLGASGVLFFSVAPITPRVTTSDPTIAAAARQPVAATITTTPLPTGRNAADDPCFVVHGFVDRIERPPTNGGLGANTSVRVTHALLELREEDTLFDDSYGEIKTGDDGEFSFSFCDDDGIFDDELELYLRITAELYEGDHLIAEVEDTDWPETNYEFDTDPFSSEGGDHGLVMGLDMYQSSIFNMADAALDAFIVWRDFGGSSTFEDEAEIQWEAGEGEDGSSYQEVFGQIYIADDPSDPDEWDDSVIIHEWGHMADDQHSCDDNPGGDHSFGDEIDPDLAWGEGYPDFWQSAVRSARGRPSANFYIDTDGAGAFRGSDLETYTRPGGGRVGDELSVAATMWDLIDPVTATGDDQVAFPLSTLQQTYVGENFNDVAYYLFDDDCDIISYLKGWLLDGRPQDANTAAAVSRNVNVSLGFLQIVLDEMGTRGAETAAATNATPPGRTRWWDEVTMVVDRSSSMAGPPAAPKIDAVKTTIGDQVAAGTALPNGTAFNVYAFDAASPAIVPLVDNKFYSNEIMPAVNAIAATGSDAGCPVPGLGALNQAIQTKYDGAAWLYTDGDSADTLSSEQMRQELTGRRVRGSIVLLGGCGSPARAQPDISGAERTYLGLAADGTQPTGLVPYLLTALGSGGQFIYVAPDQLANAADMVRAQMDHTAGAGRWSDYVSNEFTYRWDRLEPWEYELWPGWALGTDRGAIGSAGLRLPLDPPFPFFGAPTALVDVFEDGYILMNPCLLDPQFCLFGFSQYVEILDTNLEWVTTTKPPAREATAECGLPDLYGKQVRLFTKTDGDWHILSTEGLAIYGGAGSGDVACRAYQVWLNHQTGEIRFLYGPMRQEAGSAEIGLVGALLIPSTHVIVSKNNVSGAGNGMGYKFTPAPPQPTKTYTVEVDPLIESVVFLQTGYSGDFLPMAITDSNGAPVSCANTADVQCITMHSVPGDNMVQSVQVDTHGVGGVYTAVVAVGPGGSSTFSFNALAASDLTITSPDLRTLPTGQFAHEFRVDLGRAADGNLLTGWLQTPDGKPYGAAFALYDDGAHDDGAAGDGRFGSDSFGTPFAGAAYLWVEGDVDGTHFKRSDPVPFNFQPVSITQPVEPKWAYYDGASAELVFYAWNHDTQKEHCYAAAFTYPPTWTFYSPQAFGVCIPANQGTAVYAYLSAAAGSGPGGPGPVSLTLTEIYDGSITTSATGQVTFVPPPASLAFDNPWEKVPVPAGAAVDLELVLYNANGGVVDVTKSFEGSIAAEGGTVELPTYEWVHGRLPVRLTMGSGAGATIYAIAEGGLEATTAIPAGDPMAATISLAAASIDLSESDSTQLTVTVLNSAGDPASGETVRIGVSDDSGDQGTIDGAEVVERATNKQGVATAVFHKTAGAPGSVVVRAELLNESGVVVAEAAVRLYLGTPPPSVGVFLPVVRRP